MVKTLSDKDVKSSLCEQKRIQVFLASCHSAFRLAPASLMRALSTDNFDPIILIPNYMGSGSFFDNIRFMYTTIGPTCYRVALPIRRGVCMSTRET